MRRRAEALRKKMTEMRTKTRSANQPTRQPPGSDNGASAEADATSNTSASSTTSVDTTSSSQSPPVSPGSDNGASAEADATRNTSATFTTSVDTTSSSHSLPVSPASSSSSSLISNPIPGSRRARRVRVSRARRILSAFKVHIRKRTERRSVFKKDSKSVIFEAYLIYPIPGPFSGNSYPPPIKLPFGHRRLTREIKHALRKFNPWDILLILSPHHRYLVDRVVQRVQHAAAGTSHVCLVAIDVDGRVEVDGYGDENISDLEAGDLVWTRMVLFFRHEPVQVLQGTTKTEIDVTGGRPRLGTTRRKTFLGASWRSKKHLELQEKLKREQERETRAEEEKQQQELEDKAKAEMAKRDAETRAKEEKQQQELKEEVKAEMLQARRDEQRRRDISQEHMMRQQRREYRRPQREDYIRAEVSRRLQILEEDRLREVRRQQEEEEEAERREQEFKDRIEAEVMKRDAARRKHEEMEHRTQQEQNDHDRIVAKEARYELLELQRREQEARRRPEEGGEDQASKKPEVFLEDVEKGFREWESKRSEAERTKKILEEKRAEMKANEEKAAAEKAKPPITFKDATGRNFIFPFHMVQTWEVSSKLLRFKLTRRWHTHYSSASREWRISSKTHFSTWKGFIPTSRRAIMIWSAPRDKSSFLRSGPPQSSQVTQ